MDKQTDGITQIFQSNLAMMVIYLPAKFEFDWTKRFRLFLETEMLMDKQNYTDFESNLAMMVLYLPVKFEFDWKKRF